MHIQCTISVLRYVATLAYEPGFGPEHGVSMSTWPCFCLFMTSTFINLVHQFTLILVHSTLKTILITKEAHLVLFLKIIRHLNSPCLITESFHYRKLHGILQS